MVKSWNSLDKEGIRILVNNRVKHPLLQEIDKFSLEIQTLEWDIDDIDEEKEQCLEDYIDHEDEKEKEELLDKVVELMKKRVAIRNHICILIDRKVEKEMEAERLGTQNWK